MNYEQLVAIAGMLAPITYTLTWIIGGILQPDYSHIRDDVSSLMAVGAPNKRLFDIMQVFYNILSIIFFGNLHWFINKGDGSIIGPVCLLLSSIIGLVVALFFPLDEGGKIATYRGKMHVALVGLMSFSAMAGMFALWLRLIETPDWVLIGYYSLASLVITIITGLYSFRKIDTEIRGLTERLVVTATIQYFFGLALHVFLLNS